MLVKYAQIKGIYIINNTSYEHTSGSLADGRDTSPYTYLLLLIFPSSVQQTSVLVVPVIVAIIFLFFVRHTFKYSIAFQQYETASSQTRYQKPNLRGMGDGHVTSITV